MERVLAITLCLAMCLSFSWGVMAEENESDVVYSYSAGDVFEQPASEEDVVYFDYAETSKTPLTTAKTLINSLKVYPQETDMSQLTQKVDAILAPMPTAILYTKLKAAYDWLVRNVDFTWSAYNEQIGTVLQNRIIIMILWGNMLVPFLIPSLTEDTTPCFMVKVSVTIMLRLLRLWQGTLASTLMFIPVLSFGVPLTVRFMPGWKFPSTVRCTFLIPNRNTALPMMVTERFLYKYFCLSHSDDSRFNWNTKRKRRSRRFFIPVTSHGKQVRADITVSASENGTVQGGARYDIDSTLHCNGSTQERRVFPRLVRRR